MDPINKKILRLLQKDASLSLSEIASRVGLSSTPCWRRIQNLEAEGVITSRVAILNPEKVNVATTVFVAVKTHHHNIEWFTKFSDVVAGIDEIVEFHRMSGDIDYLLKIVVPDIKAYDLVYKRLIAKIDLSDVSSMFSMEPIKYSTALPLDYCD